MSKREKKDVEAILEKRAANNTIGQTYNQYLVKWKGHPIEYDSWMTTSKLQKFSTYLEALMDQSFLPREFDAGASRLSQQCDCMFTCCG